MTLEEQVAAWEAKRERRPPPIVKFKIDDQEHVGRVRRRLTVTPFGEVWLLDGDLGPVRPSDCRAAGQEELDDYRYIREARDPDEAEREVRRRRAQERASFLRAEADSLEDEADELRARANRIEIGVEDP